MLCNWNCKNSFLSIFFPIWMKFILWACHTLKEIDSDHLQTFTKMPIVWIFQNCADYQHWCWSAFILNIFWYFFGGIFWYLVFWIQFDQLFEMTAVITFVNNNYLITTIQLNCKTYLCSSLIFGTITNISVITSIAIHHLHYLLFLKFRIWTNLHWQCNVLIWFLEKFNDGRHRNFEWTETLSCSSSQHH